jgi:hypothetical protein
MAAAREKALLEVRVLHAAFVTTVFLFIVCVQLMARPQRPVSQEIVWAIAAVAFADITLGFTMRKKFMNKATEEFESKGESRALQAWRFANIYSFAHAETIVLFGFVLKFIGASWKIAGPFFFVGFALLVLWTPRLELPLSAAAPAPPASPAP